MSEHHVESRAPRRFWHVVGAALLAWAMLMAGCSTMVETPAGPEPSSTSSDKYRAAQEYVGTARANVEKAKRKANGTDVATKVGAGLGVAGAGIGAIYRAPLDVVLGFITLGATSYAVNQLSDVTPRRGIYNAGIANLQCIAETGNNAWAPRKGLEATQTQLMAGMSSVNNALNVGAEKFNDEEAAALSLLNRAEKSLRAIDQYLAASDNVPDQMVLATRATIAAVNEQVEASVPSIDAVMQAGSFFSGLTVSGANLRSILGQRPAGVTEFTHGGPLGNAAKVRLKAATDNLDSILADASKALDATKVSKISDCQFRPPAQTVITVEPTGPLAVEGGATASVTVTSKAMFRVIWIGDVPQEIDVSTDADHVTLKAKEGAKARSYRFKVVDVAGKSSPEVTVDVVASQKGARPVKKAAPKAGAAAGAAGNPGTAGPPPTPPTR